MPDTTHMTRRTEAEEIATALELGLLSVPDAIRWADAGIEADPQPPFALIEVSVAAKAPPVEVAHLLRSLPGEPGRRELARRLVCRIAGALHDGRVTAAGAARILYHMVLAELIPDPSATRRVLLTATLAVVGCEAEKRACVAPALPDLEITVEPPPAETVTGNVSFDGPCTVQDVSDAPLSIALSCEGAPGFDMMVTVTGATGEVSWAAELPVESEVELRFATAFGFSDAPAWVTVRRAGEDDPSLVVVKSWRSLPAIEGAADFMAPVELEFLDDADCAASKGSCGDGVRRRAAIEVTVPGADPVVVFGHNQDVVSSYHVRVGDAEVDHGNCEGMSKTWYEVLITKQTSPK